MNHSKIIIYVAVGLLLSLITLSCGKEDDNIPKQNYEIKLVNGLTDEPIAEVRLTLIYAIGGSFTMDIVDGITDAQGRVTLQTQVDPDSVAAILEEADWLDESQINQSIRMETDGFVLYELFQDSTKSIFKVKLEEDKLITAKAYIPIQNTLRIIDVPPRRDRDEFCIYDIFQSHPSFSFPYLTRNIGIFRLEDPDTTELNLSIAEGVEYQVEYSLSTMDSISGELDTFFQSFIEFTGDRSKEGVAFEIKF